MYSERAVRFNSLQVKILFFFTIGLLALGIVLSYTAITNNRRIHALHDARITEERTILENDLTDLTELTKALAPDYSQWDDPYYYLNGDLPDYAVDNLTEGTLDTFQTDGMWMFLNDGTLTYHINVAEESEGVVDFAPYREKIKQLFEENFAIQFNIKTKTGVMIVYGSTVVKTDDPLHEGESPGYLLVGKVFNDEVLSGLEVHGRTLVKFIPTAFSTEYPSDFPVESGKLAFDKTIHDINNAPVGRVYAVYEADSIKALHDSDVKLLEINIISFLSLLTGLFVVIWLWVIRPVNRIYKGLEKADGDLLKSMASKKTEFGKIAEMIVKFFEQEKSLKSEIESKQVLLEKLKAYNLEVELTNKVMIGRELKMIELKKQISDLTSRQGEQGS